jgi:hypothetical protein
MAGLPRRRDASLRIVPESYSPEKGGAYDYVYEHSGHHPARSVAGHRPAHTLARCPDGRSEDDSGDRQGQTIAPTTAPTTTAKSSSPIT